MNTVFQKVTLEDIQKINAKPLPLTNEYQLWRGKKDAITLTLFKSGKLLIQHPETVDVSNLLDKPIQKTKVKEKQKEYENYDDQIILGSDESLKGDTFGGIVVCGFQYNPALRSELQKLGIQDSKAMQDETCKRIANILLENYPERIYCEEKLPREYNEYTSSNQLLNQLHTAIAKNKQGKHLVDKYPGCVVGDIQVTKAEQKSLAVAAASIIARAKALEQLEYLSTKAKMQLPKGSTHVRETLQKIPKEKMNEFAKTHFSNVKKIIEHP